MRFIRKLISIVVAIILFIFGTALLFYSNYLKPVSNTYEEKIIEIKKGLNSRQIGEVLAENNVIHDNRLFVFYLKLNDVKDLKAGTYKLSPSYSLKKIVEILRKGDVYTDDTIRITFKEGINYRELASVIALNTNNSYDDVLNILNDDDYINSLINDYWFITDAIKNDKIYYSLEGYLFPDTYEFKNKDVTIPEIFKKLLDQMDNVLSPYKKKIEIDKFSVHELLTLASLAEKEVSNKVLDDARSKVVSVFVNRLNKKMALGSDITTRYGLKLDETRPLTKSEYNTSNAYNTRNANMLGLPASPICMVSKSSIEASINRIDTKYLYFIANVTTGETFFYETSKEFEAKKAELSKVNGGY
ncbi:MAG: endolytic transglycosylase MltG [Bacilli bacterium]|nr:endolytic transglycosylase MltG [Bacilli bacterium]